MKTEFRTAFVKDIDAIRTQSVLSRVAKLIEQVEAAEDLRAVPHVKKLRGAQGCFRARVGDYRVGLFLSGDVVTFVRCLDRKDVYRYFP